MTEYPYQLTARGGAGSLHLRHPLGDLDPERMGRLVSIFRPDLTAIETLLAAARGVLPQLAPLPVVQRVVAKNPDAVWAIARRLGNDQIPLPAEGFIATLPLTETGLRQLIDGSFNGADPDDAAIATAGTKPAAIYIWAAYAPGRLIAAVPLVFAELSTPLYRDADIIARAATAEGKRLSEVLGLKRNAKLFGVRTPHLNVFDRANAVQSAAPAYDTYHPGVGKRDLSVTLARSLDDFIRIAAVRATAYIEEQDCPYDEEFDGNDFSATHLLGYVGNEPAGCVRIRYFAEFAKIERMAVRKEFRHTRLVFQLARAAIDLCRKKGYTRLYCHAQRRLAPFWKRFGFRALEGGTSFVFSDFEYIELVAEMGRDPAPIALGTDPYIIIRPEGRWHKPGVLERAREQSGACPLPEAAAS